jgi:hypothetical protein
MFGETFVEVARQNFPPGGLVAGPVQPAHVRMLCEFHAIAFGDTDLAYRPSAVITEWKSCSNCLESVALTDGGVFVAYARFTVAKNVKMVIADSPKNFARAIGYLFEKFPVEEKLRSPIDPRSKIVTDLQCKAEHHPITAGMIAILDREFEPIERYCREVKVQPARCGMATWPIGYDTI